MEFHYTCTECGREFAITPDLMLCPDCSRMQEPNKPLRGILGVKIEGNISSNFDVFDFLPVEKEYFPPIPIGNTPLWKPNNLRNSLGFPNLFIKDDSLNPTGSLKDRASFLVAAFALKHGIMDVVVASTGNAASSMAGVGAAAGLNVTIFIPNNAPKAKMIQALQYGARVILVDGNYDAAFDISLEYTNKFGGFNRNTAYNPMTIEGKKTVAIEIFQQLGKPPDYLFLPVGDGVILAGVYKGFSDLKRFGFIDNIPVIYAVQSSGSDAIFRAFESDDFKNPRVAKTIADSILVDVPRNGYLAVKLLKEHSGRCIAVSDDSILRSQYELSSSTGIFTEPAGAASFAGFHAVKETLPKKASIVILSTGNGLKDIESASKGVDLPDNSIRTLREIL